MWDLRLKPGESTPMHRHQCDYLYVVIGDGQLQRIDPDGTRTPITERTDGEVVFRAVQGENIHAAHNAGETAWRNIVIELKE